MCQSGGFHRMGGTWRQCCCGCGCYCGCGCGHGSGNFFRRFISREEEKEKLEEYRDQLKKELTGVEERIRELEGK